MRLALAAAAVLLLSSVLAARRVDPAEERFKAADALMDKGDYAAAREELLTARVDFKTGDARFVRYHERNGASWLREGKIKEARAAFTIAIRHAQRLAISDVSLARALTGMGLCLRREGKDQLALRFFHKALSARPDEGTRMFLEDQIQELKAAPPPSR
ncbi:MAG: tetratricopeptide repeat protein [Elusimicrobiota bacterium]